MATPSRAQMVTALAVSSTERGVSRIGVLPVQRLRHSVSDGAMTSASWVQPPGPSAAFNSSRTAEEGAVVLMAPFCQASPFVGRRFRRLRHVM